MSESIKQIALDHVGVLYVLTDDGNVYWLGKQEMMWHAMPAINKSTIWKEREVEASYEEGMDIDATIGIPCAPSLPG